MAHSGPTIRRARAQEAGALTALTLRSKAHWGYSAEQMSVFRDELTFTPAAVVERRAHVVEEDGVVVAMYTLFGEGDEVELEHLFVDPARLRRGHGKRLFEHACDLARAAGARALVIKSDPNAAGFYRAMGAADAGEIPSSIPGRHIPTFRLLLRP
jgi:N-acetylglutamate synthase-like GNAT family acetyltransferase